jgi:hypothetical protein
VVEGGAPAALAGRPGSAFQRVMRAYERPEGGDHG